MSRSLHCPACTHQDFRALIDRNDERRVECQGCDARFTLDELKRIPDGAVHHITSVDVGSVHGTPNEWSYEITIKYVDETHTLDCAIDTESGDIGVTHRTELDAISWMDEDVMEEMCRQFIEDTKDYLTG